MLYLFNSAGRGGYIDNVLNTMYLPHGAQNVYQYTYEGDSYVDSSVPSGKLKGRSIKDDEVLIVFVNKDKSPYEYIPLRKGKLLLKEDKNGRSYFYVSLTEHCYCKHDLAHFNKEFIKMFRGKLFSSNESQTKDVISKKNNKGFLAFYGSTVSSLIESNDSSWKKTVKKLSDCSVFKNGAIFTRLKLFKKDKTLDPVFLPKVGKATFVLKKGCTYSAELDYYIPFHDNNTIASLDVELVSNPDIDMLRGAALTQKFNVMDGIARYVFFPIDVSTGEEILFRLRNCDHIDNQGEIRISSKPFVYRVRRSMWQIISLFGLTVVNVVLLFYINYYTKLIDSIEKISDLDPQYFVILAITTLLSTASIGLITKVFSRKK